MFFHRDRRTTKPAARTPLRPKGSGGIVPSATLPLLTDGRASASSWRLASGPMALVTRPCRVLPRVARESECRGTELNRRRPPFQGGALPTELPRLEYFRSGGPDQTRITRINTDYTASI